MKTGRKTNKTMKNGLGPAHMLWKLYCPEKARYHFNANTVAKAKKWQKTTARALENLIGFQDMVIVRSASKMLERVDKGDYIREKILIQTTRDSVMPVYILTPKQIKKPLQTVLALHGHGYGVKDIVGLWENGTERDIPDGYHKDFAVSLCRRGFVVVAPEILCFGERTTDFSYLNELIGQAQPTTCAHAANLSSHLGFTILGVRVFEMRRLIDYLGSRREIDSSRIGVMGISGGGLLTFFLTAVEQRIKACVVSGYFCTFKNSVLAMHHCPCNFVPGLGQFGEMYDIAGLIAPRPMLIEAGSNDSIFPIASARKSVQKTRKIYSLFGARDNIQTDYFQGRHQISGKKAYDFLSQKLD